MSSYLEKMMSQFPTKSIERIHIQTGIYMPILTIFTPILTTFPLKTWSSKHIGNQIPKNIG